MQMLMSVQKAMVIVNKHVSTNPDLIIVNAGMDSISLIMESRVLVNHVLHTDSSCIMRALHIIIIFITLLFCVIDFDECLVPGTNNCEQDCTNNDGSYNCSCFNGYTLLSNGFQCEGMWKH